MVVASCFPSNVPAQVVAVHPDYPFCQPLCINKRVLRCTIYVQRSSPKDGPANPATTTSTDTAAVACSKWEARYLRWVEREACCSPGSGNRRWHEQTFVIVHSSAIVNPRVCMTSSEIHNVSIYPCICVCVYINISKCVYIYVCVSLYTHTHIYINIQTVCGVCDAEIIAIRVHTHTCTPIEAR